MSDILRRCFLRTDRMEHNMWSTPSALWENYHFRKDGNGRMKMQILYFRLETGMKPPQNMWVTMQSIMRTYIRMYRYGKITVSILMICGSLRMCRRQTVRRLDIPEIITAVCAGIFCIKVSIFRSSTSLNWSRRRKLHRLSRAIYSILSALPVESYS